MEHGLSPFGRGNLHPCRNPLDRQRWKCPPGRPHDPSRDRSRQDIPLAWRASWCQRVGITVPGHAKNTFEKEPQIASLRRDQSMRFLETPYYRQNLRELPGDALCRVWQNDLARNQSEKRFSFGRTAASTTGCVKSKFSSRLP